jgi:hypothetical protein
MHYPKLNYLDFVNLAIQETRTATPAARATRFSRIGTIDAPTRGEHWPRMFALTRGYIRWEDVIEMADTTTVDKGIDGLDGTFFIEDRPEVARFIEENRLRTILLDAREALSAAFGERPIKTLTLVRDDEGFDTLFCLVMVPGDMQEARHALESFDQRWWLARSAEAAGKLNFDFQLV